MVAMSPAPRPIACARHAHLWPCRHLTSIWTRSACWTPLGGSGALGLEMLSRGARSLTTFEIERNAARLITKNIESLCRDRARWRVVTGDMLASASRGRVPGGPFDLVLLDPPYAFGAEPVEILLQNLAQQGLLATWRLCPV